MTYQEAIQYLFHLEFFGVKLGLENIQRLMELLENPQNHLRVIHIAGTNGKGSVAAYISNILQASGYKVGLYTSPHLERFEERIQTNGKLISKESVILLTRRIQPIAKEIERETNGIHPTFFEVTTAMALCYFFEEKVDFVVLEVGLGGRLDATNVVNADIAVITTIDFDHMQQLGNTISEIAREKAGIIKPNATVITGAQGKALTEIENIAKRQNAKLITYPKNISYQKGEFRSELKISKYQEFTVSGQLGEYNNLKTKLLGEHQLMNATLSIGAVESLILTHDTLDKQKILDKGITDGIYNTSWPGRLEIIKENPLVLLDGAHNPAGAKVLQKTLKDTFNYNNLYLIMGITAGKEAEKIIEILSPLAKEVVVTSAQNHRVIPVNQLSKMVLKHSDNIKIAKKVSDAVKYVLQKAEDKDLVCITGSLYVVGEARDYLVNLMK